METGAIYRCLALRATREQVGAAKEARLAAMAAQLAVRFVVRGEENRVMLDDEDVTAAIRDVSVGNLASRISAQPGVRTGLLALQRNLALAARQGAVLEGRDIGTVIFPDADLKIFLEAAPEVRAQRRSEELRRAGAQVDLGTVHEEQVRRDRADSSRTASPLIAAPDAVHVDSTSLTHTQVLQQMVDLVSARYR